MQLLRDKEMDAFKCLRCGCDKFKPKTFYSSGIGTYVARYCADNCGWFDTPGIEVKPENKLPQPEKKEEYVGYTEKIAVIYQAVAKITGKLDRLYKVAKEINDGAI